MKDRKRAWDFISSNIFTLSTVVAGVVVLVLQQIDKVSTEQVLAAILALLALLATSEIVDKSKKLDRIEDSIMNGFHSTLKALDNADVYKFPLIDEGFDYVAQRLREAQHTVDHVGFAPLVPRWSKQSLNYEKARLAILKSNKIKYRYIFTVCNDGEKISRITTYLSDPNIKQYFPACYIQPEDSFPAFSFILIDQEELIIYYSGVEGEPEFGLSIRNSDIVQIQINFFRRLWAYAIPLNIVKAKEISQRFSKKG